MCTNSLKSLIVRLGYAVVLGCSCAVAQAQLTNVPDFFERHFRIEAQDAEDGPKLRTQFNYTASDALSTRNTVKFNNDGFEDHMAVGLAQNFGAARAKVTYNLQRYNYASWESQTDDVTVDFRYRSLRLQRRIENTAQTSTIGLPIKLSTAHIDLSYSQIMEMNSVEPIDAYRFVSRLNGLTFSAAWQASGGKTWADFSTEFRPSNCWLMQYIYADHGEASQHQFRSEYVGRDYRLSGEYNAQTEMGVQTHMASAICIEQNTKLAALKLRLEYNDYADTPTLAFKVETHIDF
jgi:hypothetical protein